MDEQHAVDAEPGGVEPAAWVPPFTDRDLAREASARGNKTKRTRAAGLEELARLPELVAVASAKECLARLLELAVVGGIAGTLLNGSVRAVEVFLKAVDGEVNRTELTEALRLLRELKARPVAGRRP